MVIKYWIIQEMKNKVTELNDKELKGESAK